MKDEFNNLKEKMNESVFKDIRFDEKHQQDVLKAIKKSKKQVYWGPKVNHLINIAATVFLVVGIGYYAVNQIWNTPQFQENAESSITDDQSSTTIIKAENYQDMTKAEIVDLLENSEHHFETARGTFIYKYLLGNHERKVEYAINLNEKDDFGGYSREETISQDSSYTNYRYYNKDTLWVLHENTLTYEKSSYRTIEAAEKEGDKYWNPPIGMPELVLFSYPKHSDDLIHFDTWDIEKQNEKILGHNTVVIKVKPHSDMGEYTRYWVDKDTGIILKFEVYDSEDQVINSLETISLEVNVPISKQELTPPDLEELGYKKS